MEISLWQYNGHLGAEKPLENHVALGPSGFKGV